MELITRYNNITQPRYQHTISTVISPLECLAEEQPTFTKNSVLALILKCLKYSIMSQKKRNTLNIYIGTMVGKLIGFFCSKIRGHSLEDKMLHSVDMTLSLQKRDNIKLLVAKNTHRHLCILPLKKKSNS